MFYQIIGDWLFLRDLSKQVTVKTH